MTIKHDESRYQVAICEIHELNATPQEVRKLVSKKISDYEEFTAKAKELGFDIVPSSGQIQTIEKLSQPAQPAQPTQQPADKQPSDGKPNRPRLTVQKKSNRAASRELSPEEAEAARQKMQDQSYPDTKERARVEQHSQYDKKEGAPQNFSQEMQVVAGRGGAPVTVPKRIIGEAGTTDIRVINTGGDRELQRRFKNMAEGTLQDKHPGFKDSYEAKSCSTCDGAGNVDRKECPRCNGAGIIF